MRMRAPPSWRTSSAALSSSPSNDPTQFQSPFAQQLSEAVFPTVFFVEGDQATHGKIFLDFPVNLGVEGQKISECTHPQTAVQPTTLCQLM